jgi:hypothetical protein
MDKDTAGVNKICTIGHFSLLQKSKQKNTIILGAPKSRVHENEPTPNWR